MGIADWIRIMRGNLTPEEIAERDARARERAVARQAEAQHRAVEVQQDDQYSTRTYLAASVSSVVLICHTDTWQEIRRLTWGDYPPNFENRITHLDNDMLQVHVSGQNLVSIVTRTAYISGAIHPNLVGSFSRSDRIVAGRIYDIVGAVIDTVDPTAAERAPIPPIVVDDQSAAQNEEDGA